MIKKNPKNIYIYKKSSTLLNSYKLSNTDRTQRVKTSYGK